MSESVYIAGAFEHPTREAPDKSTMQLHAEVAMGALDDAGLSKDAMDAYFTAGIPEMEHGLTPLMAADYLGLDVSYTDTTDYGGSSYVAHVGHAASAIRDGKCDIALVTLAGRPRSRGQATGSGTRDLHTVQDSFERIYGTTNITMYGMAARRHMHEYFNFAFACVLYNCWRLVDILVQLELDGEVGDGPAISANSFLTFAKKSYGLDPPD